MKDGNSFTQGSLSAQKGWFKVVFVALDATGKPTGKEVEYYLANFDSSKDAESGLANQIRTGWSQVDLSGLGDISILISCVCITHAYCPMMKPESSRKHSRK